MRPCHVIPSKISAHVAFVSVIRLSDVSKRFDGRAGPTEKRGRNP